jgi:hypothetical protein
MSRIRVLLCIASVCFASLMLSDLTSAQTLTPALNFGNWAIDTSSTAQLATLKNTTSSAITITGATVATGFTIVNNNCPHSPATLGAGQSCQIGVKFSPTATNPYSGNLKVNYNTSNSVTDPVSGTGIPDVSLTPTSWTPGNEVINTTTAQTTFTIKNNETAASVTVTSVVPPAGFTVNNTCATIAASGTCQFTATFDPTAVTSYSGNVTVSDTTASGSQQQTAALSGNGIYPTVPASFFAMDINQNNTVNSISTDPWPSTVTTPLGHDLAFGTFRTLGSSIKWADLASNRTSCTSYQNVTYIFESQPNLFQTWISQAQSNGQAVMFTAYYTPQCLSSVPTDTSCAFATQPGGCDLPSDVSQSGSGQDATWINFLTRLFNSVGPNAIQYLEVWNEPNVPTECNARTGNCNATNLAIMVADAQCIVKSGTITGNSRCTTGQGLSPNTQIISPPPTANMPSSGNCTGTAETISNFLSSLLTASPSVASTADLIGFHGYVAIPGTGTGYSNPPDPAAGAACENDLINNPSPTTGNTGVRAFVSQYTSKPLYDTEGSWGANCKAQGCTYIPDTWIQGSTMPLSAQDQAEEAAFTGIYYLIQASNTICPATFSTCNSLLGLSWYGWDFDGQGDPGSTGQFWYQSTSALGAGGIAYDAVNSWLLGKSQGSLPASPASSCSSTSGNALGVWTCQFKGSGTYSAVAVWDTNQTCIGISSLPCPYPNSTSFTFPAGTYTEWRDLYDGTPHTISNTTTSLPIGLVPILVDNGQ